MTREQKNSIDKSKLSPRYFRHYVNPKVCSHRLRTLKTIANLAWFECQTCGLCGKPVNISRFRYWTKCKCARAFAIAANFVDKDSKW